MPGLFETFKDFVYHHKRSQHIQSMLFPTEFTGDTSCVSFRLPALHWCSNGGMLSVAEAVANYVGQNRRTT